MAYTLTKEDGNLFINIEKGEGDKWVLLYTINGYDYDMKEAMSKDSDFGKKVVAVFNTKEAALKYYDDNKLYEKAYKDLLDWIDCNYDDDDWEDKSPDDLMQFMYGNCYSNESEWREFLYELVPTNFIDE